MSMIGAVIAAGAVGAYLAMLTVHRFTYRTWIFDITVVVGIAAAMVGRAQGGSWVGTFVALGAGLFWFVVLRNELRVKGSPELSLEVGGRIPPFEVVTASGDVFTDRDLVERAPVILQLYRGWWCPSTHTQLDEMVDQADALASLGVTVLAASVDSPEDAAPLQDRLGGSITVLCNVQDTMLDAIGVRDHRGAPWYDRLMNGTEKRSIAMPSAIAVDVDGAIVYVHRSERVDQRALPEDILASFM